MFDLIAIGDTFYDVFLALDEEEAKVSCSLDKENCLICLHYADKIPVKSLHRALGGNAPNVAVGAQRLGLKTAVVTQLGDDDLSDWASAELQRGGVDTRFVKRDEHTRINYTTAINWQGERTLLTYHEKREYHLPVLPATQWLYLSSLRVGSEMMLPALFEYLKDNPKVRVGFNPGTYQLRAGAAVFNGILQRCAVIFLNVEEAKLFLGIKNHTPIKILLDGLRKLGPKMAVITDGKEGAYASDGKTYLQLGIYDVPRVEMTGAGDSFATGFMAAMFYGKNMAEALRWGAFNAASVIQKIGPEAGLLDKKQMEAESGKRKDFQPKKLM